MAGLGYKVAEEHIGVTSGKSAFTLPKNGPAPRGLPSRLVFWHLFSTTGATFD